MKLLPFKTSSARSIGIELEYQIIDPMTFDLISRAKDLIRNIGDNPHQKIIKPEITQSMIEINSSIHHFPQEMHQELINVRDYLLSQADNLGIYFCGGGTHPFQKWHLRKIFPTSRFRNKANQYRYLSKRATVFGQHIHVGCSNAEDALYLTHALTRYVPQLIAISASSPFYQTVDTGFCSSRLNVFCQFPTSGVIPFLTCWKEFSAYYYKMRQLGIINSMKDTYWDIRPKPEFGTVEIRVCDTPLTIEKAIILAAYTQILAHYILEQRPVLLTQDLYYLYATNRFSASRYGFSGDFIHPNSLEHITIYDDIMETMNTLAKYTNHFKSSEYIAKLHELVLNHENDSVILRNILEEVKVFPKVVNKQCLIWKT